MSVFALLYHIFLENFYSGIFLEIFFSKKMCELLRCQYLYFCTTGLTVCTVNREDLLERRELVEYNADGPDVAFVAVGLVLADHVSVFVRLYFGSVFVLVCE